MSKHVEFWKNNEKPFGLCPKEMQKWARENPGLPWELYIGSGWGKTGHFIFMNADTYRIATDHEPEGQGWVEYEVEEHCDRYRIIVGPRPLNGEWLHHTPYMKGFLGIIYRDEATGQESRPTTHPLIVQKFGEGWEFHDGVLDDSDVRPAVPVRVRFAKVEKEGE